MFSTEKTRKISNPRTSRGGPAEAAAAAEAAEAAEAAAAVVVDNLLF
jgi:hypothetical protein